MSEFELSRFYCNLKLIIFCGSKEHFKTSKAKTWSRGTNSLLPFGANVSLNVYIFFCVPVTYNLLPLQTGVRLYGTSVVD